MTRYDQALALWQKSVAASGDQRVFGAKACHAFLTHAAVLFPQELAWATDVAQNHTTYSRRRYGNVTYCWADADVVLGNGRDWHTDPWPAINYPRTALVSALVLAKAADPLAAVKIPAPV
jgi:hypothetical protein